METEPVALVKPERHPDYISNNYSCFWFEEMLYMDYDSKMLAITTDQESGMLMIKRETLKKCGRCTPCSNKKTCEQNYFAGHVQEARDKWWYDTFESKFLGEDDVTKST